MISTKRLASSLTTSSAMSEKGEASQGTGVSTHPLVSCVLYSAASGWGQ